jgi:addiction module HigA family antidote
MAGYREQLTRLFLEGEFARAQAGVSRQAEAPFDAPSLAATARSPAAVDPRNREKAMTHPGELLARHLRELGVSATELARQIDVPVNRVTAILNGQRGVTADTALRLGHWFGVGPEAWLELQMRYELGLAQRAVGSAIKKLPRLADRRSV